MVTILVNMMTYMNTLKIKQLTEIKNSVFHHISSIALAKIKVNNENYGERLESYDDYYKIKKMIHANDRFIGDNYNSLIFDQMQFIVMDYTRMKISGKYNIDQLYEYIIDFKIINTDISYIEMRYLCHKLTSRLRHLRLINCNITDSKLNCLIGLNLYSLIDINLAKNPITDNVIKIVSNCKIPNLLGLNLCGTNVTPHLFQLIKDNYEALSKLKFLDMVFNDEWNHVIDATEIREFAFIRMLCRKKHLTNYDRKKDKYLLFCDDSYVEEILNTTNSSSKPVVEIDN